MGAKAARQQILDRQETAIRARDRDLEANISVMYPRRDPDMVEELFAKVWAHDNPIWQTFKRIIGDASKTLLVVDLVTKQVRIVYKLTLFREMDSNLLQEFQFNFDYVCRDQTFHATIKCNHAKTEWQIKCIEYHVAMEQEFAFGTYAMPKTIPTEQLLEHFSNGIHLHRNLGLRFLWMALVYCWER